MESEPNPKKLYGDLKAPLQLVPPAAMLATAFGLAEGAAKYGAYNWRDQPVEAMTYIGAIYRHLAAYVEGEDFDPDSAIGKTHLEGAIANLAILIDATDAGTLIDNRWGKIKKSARGALEKLQRGANQFACVFSSATNEAKSSTPSRGGIRKLGKEEYTAILDKIAQSANGQGAQ